MSDERHDEAKALALIRAAHERPQPLTHAEAQDLLCRRVIDGMTVPARIEGLRSPWVARVGRPRKVSRWRPAYWHHIGRGAARTRAVEKRREAGTPLQRRVAAAVGELVALGVPRSMWAGLLARGTLRKFLDAPFLLRLCRLWGHYSLGAAQKALAASSLPPRGLGHSEDRIRRALRKLGY